MMRYKVLLVITLFFCAHILSAQVSLEKEYRIRKDQFPEKAIRLVKEQLTNYRKLKYYKEIDSSIFYKIKLKKDQLKYSLSFTEDGSLKHIDIEIKAVDILEESYQKIMAYLNQQYSSYRIKKMEQQYAVDSSVEKTFKKAFQNLITPQIKYKFSVRGKQQSTKFQNFEILFNAEGSWVTLKKSLPPNYDHVLY